jgi:hypothetical protein
MGIAVLQNAWFQLYLVYAVALGVALTWNFFHPRPPRRDHRCHLATRSMSRPGTAQAR